MTVELKEVPTLDLKSITWVVTSKPSSDHNRVDEGIHVVILARNEASVLGGTLRALSMILEPKDQVHVVADHCRDTTAHVARKAGAQVLIRADGGPDGKGQALKWWLEETKEDASPDEIIIILDADSRVAPNFFESIRKRMTRGEGVIQARVEPVVRTTSPVSRLAAYSETTEQRVNDAFRARLGWPVRLRGTGMAFRRGILEEVCSSLSTFVEDVEMTLQLGAQKIPIHFAHETYIADPKPNDGNGAARQRARWIKGQTQVVTTYFAEIMKLIARGPAGWSLLSSVLLKPKTLLLPLKALLTLGAWLAAFIGSSGLWLIPAWIGTLSLFMDAATFIYSLRYAADKREALWTLALAPIYMAMWLRSLTLSAMSGTVWHRVRPINPVVPIQEPRLIESLERYLKINHSHRAISAHPVVADGGD